MADENKKPYKKIRRSDMDVSGESSSVKVVNGNIELALKVFKTKIKDGGKLEEVRNRREYIKPSAIKREKIQQAVRAESRRRRIKN